MAATLLLEWILTVQIMPYLSIISYVALLSTCPSDLNFYWLRFSVNQMFIHSCIFTNIFYVLLCLSIASVEWIWRKNQHIRWKFLFYFSLFRSPFIFRAFPRKHSFWNDIKTHKLSDFKWNILFFIFLIKWFIYLLYNINVKNKITFIRKTTEKWSRQRFS